MQLPQFPTQKEIIEKIRELNALLARQYDEMAKKYGFHWRGRRVVFSKEIRLRNMSFRIPTWKYAIPTHIRHFLSIPFIYSIIIPAVILDVFMTVYQLVCFPLYRIPKVKRRDYITYDRQFLDYLNVIQKFNCIYCSYVNGLFAYASEIAARTERYWCPVKAAHRPKAHHTWYSDFADYGSPEEWEQRFNDLKAFEKLQNENAVCKKQ